jgi:hypothetical protein
VKPTKKVLQKAIASVKSSFTVEIIEFGFTPTNRNQFGISVLNVRSGKKILLDCYFTIKTGKLVRCITVEESFISSHF